MITKNKIKGKNYLKIGVLLLLTILLFTNCNNDNEQLNYQKSKFNLRHITYNELNQKGDFNELIKGLETRFSKKIQSKSVSSNDGSFTINTDFIYETSNENTTNYTFFINRTDIDSLKYENLIISKNNLNNELSVFVNEFNKYDETYQVNLYQIDNSSINMDSLNLGKIIYVYGQEIEVDDCAEVTYDSCNGNGNADGHAPTSNCAGSATVIDFTFCGSGISSENNSNGSTDSGGGIDSNFNNNQNNNNGTTGVDTSIHGAVAVITNEQVAQFSEIDNLISQLEILLIQPLSTEQENWIRTNQDNANDILQFLNNNNSQEAQNIAIEIIDFSINSPFNLDTTELNDNIFPLPNDGTPEAIKLDCIFRKLMDSPKFKSLFVNTFGQSENVNIKFEIVNFTQSPSGEIASGSTVINNPTNIRNQTIKMDRSHLLSDHPLSIAQTIIHEVLHAFINIKVAQCIESPNTTTTFNDINELNQLSFDMLLNDFAIDCDVANLFDHRLMYNRMVFVMDEMLGEVFNDLVDPEDLIANYWLPTVDEQFNWNNAVHYLNLSSLQEAQEYIEDVNTNPNLGLLVPEYSNMINNSNSGFNHNTCN